MQRKSAIKARNIKYNDSQGLDFEDFLIQSARPCLGDFYSSGEQLCNIDSAFVVDICVREEK